MFQDKSRGKGNYILKEISLRDKAKFYGGLSSLIDSGLDLLEAILVLQEKTDNKHLRYKLYDLITYIKSGDSFFIAIKKLPDVFSSMEISMIGAWEKKKKLSIVLDLLADRFNKGSKLDLKIKQVTSFPFILLFSLFFSLIGVFIYIIPSIISSFEWKGILASSLIFVSSFFQSWIIVIVPILLLFIAFAFYYKNTENWSGNIARIILSLPFLWNIYRKYILYFAVVDLWNCLDLWIWLEKSFGLLWWMVDNVLYKLIFYDVSSGVWDWESISDIFKSVDEDNDFFPADFVEIFLLEMTGNFWLKFVKKCQNNILLMLMIVY